MAWAKRLFYITSLGTLACRLYLVRVLRGCQCRVVGGFRRLCVGSSPSPDSFGNPILIEQNRYGRIDRRGSKRFVKLLRIISIGASCSDLIPSSRLP